MTTPQDKFIQDLFILFDTYRRQQQSLLIKRGMLLAKVRRRIGLTTKAPKATKLAKQKKIKVV